MCELKIISETKTGQLFYLRKQSIYWMNFKNICYEFTPYELKKFKTYLSELKISKTSCSNPGCACKFAVIPTAQSNLLIRLEIDDLAELKQLMFNKEKQNLISFHDINYNLSWN